MKIGIIVHSFTGNTLSVAQRIRERLEEAGHSVVVGTILVKGGEQRDTQRFELENPPDAGIYNALVFGAPVRGFSLSPIMAAYLKQAAVKGKKTACYVTKQLPSNWTGGKRALRAMKSICETSGATVCATGTVFWKSDERDEMIEKTVAEIAAAF